MKYVKMLGLGAVLAAALMALAGVGTASASVFCKTNIGANCAGLWDIPAGTMFEASLKTGTSSLFALTDGTTTNTCSGSTLEFKTANTGKAGEAVTASFANTQLTWAGCTNSTKTTAGGTLEFLNIAGTTNGTVMGSNFELTIFSMGIDCVYKAVGGKGEPIDLGTFKEGNPAVIEIHTVLLAQTFGCFEHLTWVAAYTITKPASTTIGVSAS